MPHTGLLRHDQTLFRDPDVFEPTYLPEHLHHRDAQVQEIAFLLQPALRGGSALSAVLRGLPGTGKTTTVRRVFAAITEETRRVAPVYVNCRHDHSALAVYRSIFRQVCGYPAGRHLDEIKQGIAARLRDRDAALVVCLDDADELIVAGIYNTILYQILRLYEKWDVRMTALSGGQTRSLLVADAVMIAAAPIILLDEVENAGIFKERVIEVLRDAGKAVVFVTHDPLVSLLSARRIVMRDGAVDRIIEPDGREIAALREARRLDDILRRMREEIRAGNLITESIGV